MNIKKIISKFGPKEKEEQKTFLAVEISAETVKSALWTVEEAKTKIIKIGSLQEWDGTNKDLLLTAIDNSISATCEGQTTEPKGMIFGLPKDWIEENQIIEAKKDLLKFICQKLELKPLGFVLSLEALVTQLKNEEGTPVNAIFVQLQENQSFISLVQLGKIKGTKVVGRSGDLAADVNEGLARFKKEDSFPARMIIFNGTCDLEEYKQQLTSYNWQEDLPFLHFPKVEVLGSNKSIRSVAIAGGTEVAKSLGFKIKETEEATSGEKPTPKTQKKFDTLKNYKSSEKSSDLSIAKGVSASDLGFVQDKDIAQEETKLEKKPEPPIEKATEEQQSQPELEETPAETSLKPPVSALGKILAFFKKSVFNFRLLFIQGRKRLNFILGFLGLLFIGGGCFAFYWYVPKAKITVFLAPKTVTKELEITVDTTNNSVDEKNKAIPGEQKEITVEGEKTTTTTGEKIIGDKAKGEVIIYNKTDVEKTFPQGSVLVGPQNLKFILDEEVIIASRSSESQEEGEQVVYGKKAGGIAAASIGTESNLEGGSIFTFKDYSSTLFSAKSEAGLSGGTSRQVKVVADEDIQNLLAQLTDELKEKTTNKLSEEKAIGKEIISQKMEEEILDKEWSAEKDEETDQLSLKLKIKFLTFIYDRKDLQTVLAALIKNDVPGDFIFDPERAEIEVKKITVERNKAKMEVLIKAYLLPKLNFEEIKKNITGLKLQNTKNYLEQLPNFTRADIEITPNFLGKLKRLPPVSKNIIIETEVEE